MDIAQWFELLREIFWLGIWLIVRILVFLNLNTVQLLSEELMLHNDLVALVKLLVQVVFRNDALRV